MVTIQSGCVTEILTKNMGHDLSNEVFESQLASKLSEQQANTSYLGAAMKKSKNGHILPILLLHKIYMKKGLTRLGPCERDRTQLSEYVEHMGVQMIFGQVITAQSQNMVDGS